VSKGRVEAFSDGVLAIIITSMVLELRAPHGVDPAALRPLIPVFLSYVLSFVFVGIYWNNHHHLFTSRRRSPAVRARCSSRPSSRPSSLGDCGDRRPKQLAGLGEAGLPDRGLRRQPRDPAALP